MSDILFFLMAFAAAVAGTIVGFGSSTIALPLSLYFFDFKTALVLIALFHMFETLSRSVLFFKQINKRLLLLFGLPSIVFSFVGASLVGFFSQETMKLALGIFLLAHSMAALFFGEKIFPVKKRSAIAGGIVSGFVAGLIGTAGAIRGAFLASFDLEKKEYIGTAGAIALATDLTRIHVYLGSNFLETQYHYIIPVLFVIAVIGSFIGKKIVEKTRQETFRKILFIALALIGLKFILDAFKLF